MIPADFCIHNFDRRGGLKCGEKDLVSGHGAVGAAADRIFDLWL